jgi:hypothetical protein
MAGGPAGLGQHGCCPAEGYPSRQLASRLGRSGDPKPVCQCEESWIHVILMRISGRFFRQVLQKEHTPSRVFHFTQSLYGWKQGLH